eukprot:12936321-Prorocentrum_lima.AAC.1
MESSEEDSEKETSAEASFAPRREEDPPHNKLINNRSGGEAVWREAELVATITGVRLGFGVRHLLKELLDPE